VTSAAAALLSGVYSTTVGGKSYSGNIQQSQGTYEISVPNLPGASASGSSLEAAEIALNVRIDALV
jgi:predicted RNase H-like HicB family nuclease